jgi:hypothetical protein
MHPHTPMNSGRGAAMLLLFDIGADAIDEHDDWHTHEHLPERLAIPGFERGSRWIAQGGPPRYFVMYEVQEIAVLGSAPYLERLNNPTPWTSKMMACYCGMRRALCEVVASCGAGLGSTALLIRFAADAEHGDALHEWLAGEVLPALVKRRGIASARLFATALEAAPTREQQIRGRDAGLQSALLVTGYEGDVVAALAQGDLRSGHFAARGALMADYASGVFRNAITLTARDCVAGDPS